MKKSRLQLSREFLILLFLLMMTIVQGQPIAQLQISNDTLLDSKTFQFDVYIRNKPGTSYANLNLSSYSLSFKDSLVKVYNNGTLTPTWVSGSSQLAVSLQPYAASISIAPTSAPTRITHGGISTLGSGYMALDTNWVRMYTIKISNSVAYLANRMNLNFNYISGSAPFKITYYDGSNYNAIATCDTTTYRGSATTSNPYLNLPITSYTLSNTGNTVNLSGSDNTGVIYYLYNNGSLYATTLGTGSALSWSN